MEYTSGNRLNVYASKLEAGQIGDDTRPSATLGARASTKGRLRHCSTVIPTIPLFESATKTNQPLHERGMLPLALTATISEPAAGDCRNIEEEPMKTIRWMQCVIAFFAYGTAACAFAIKEPPIWKLDSLQGILGFYNTCAAAYAAGAARAAAGCPSCTIPPSLCSEPFHAGNYYHVAGGPDFYPSAVCRGGSNSNDGISLFMCELTDDRPSAKTVGKADPCCGDPVNPALGNNYQIEADRGGPTRLDSSEEFLRCNLCGL
jgi:hypothetical protein